MDDPSSVEPDLTEPRVSISIQQAAPIDPEMLVSLGERVLDGEGAPTRCEVSVALVADDVIAAMNAAHLNRAGPTDVLAFPLSDLRPGRIPVRSPSEPPLALGDVIIAPEQVRRQAESLGVGFGDELCLMLVHGILHLLGYDHVDDGDAELMEQRERELLATVGVDRR